MVLLRKTLSTLRQGQKRSQAKATRKVADWKDSSHGKDWRRAAASVPLSHPKKSIAEAWPKSDLNAFDHADDMGWGNVMNAVLKSRGWTVKAPCHAVDGERSTCMFVKEFEATIRRKDPKALFGKKGAVQEGHKLRKIPLGKRALWMQGVSSTYRVPLEKQGRMPPVTDREDFARLAAKHMKELPGKAGDFRTCGYPGVYNALAKTTFSEYFREAPWYPAAYLLPQEKDTMLKRFEKNPNEYWICKPRNDCSGVGICVMKADDRSLKWLVEHETTSSIVQRYLADPVLLGGYKFHMRIHLVITSLSPPEAYVQAGGQCLFCTKPYTLAKDTLGARFDPPVHLSNTGLNMDEPQKDCFLKKKPVIGAGQQISMEQLEKYLAKTYGKRFDRDRMWKEIVQVAKENVEYLAQAPGIKRHGKFGPDGFFDMFGMDLMLDKNLKVWMCETNNTPGLDDQDKKVFGGITNPDYWKEHKCFDQIWNDLFTLLGLDAKAKKQTKGTLKNWYQIDFSKGSQ